MSTVTATRLFVRGRVQGVGYRAWLARAAGKQGLSGWVRNRQDGSVEALILAPSDTLAAFVALCRVGPAAAHVTEVATEDATIPASDAEAGFTVRPTV
ncbi:acylphosphatase [Ancylobacter polymorphus]|uniref:acylphosphatase n=1 Tax=Ancylobacter polymorphus TaxID=223390 RepID=A0ABU0B600_9HYPH|nr:acylphosphatase [Ancylobacter polymorphus]MDQ0301024.1 acylphosphatase [Ancylobacter polymorphus]